MEAFVKLCLIFCVGCIGGWILEFFYRRLVHKKWINPGFLVGPYLPLYGVGVLLLYLICSIDFSWIENTIVRDLVIVLIITIVMTVIEYITGKIFIVNMKIKLWDYTNQWGNIEGIICPLFTVIWGVIGAIYYFFIHQYIKDIVFSLDGNISLAFLVGAFWGCFVIDNIYSFKVVTKLKQFAKNNDIIIHYEKFKVTIRERAKEIHQKSILFFPFKTQDLQNFLMNYKQIMNGIKDSIISKKKKVKNKDNKDNEKKDKNE